MKSLRTDFFSYIITAGKYVSDALNTITVLPKNESGVTIDKLSIA
jgi:hypothetical protein